MIERIARAKLNLALHVRGRRADGYHDLETLFAFVADGDVLRVEPAERDDFRVTGPFASGLSPGRDNLVIRALDGFRAGVAPVGPLAITLDKRLPVASGIGGGSADAAAMIAIAAELAGIDAADPRLFALALALGSDVPACLLGRTAIGTGRGEHLTAIEGAPGMPVLLVNPGVAVSTAAVFRRWQGKDGGPIGEGTLVDRALVSRNDLEAPAIAVAPVIAEVLDRLRGAAGERLVRMSGSGATCFALFDDRAVMAGARMAIEAARPDWWCLETALT